MFNVDAACCLLDDILAHYSLGSFTSACADLNESWGPESNYKQQLADIDRLCLELVLAPVLSYYGFSPDEGGNKEVNALVADLATASGEVMAKKTQVRRLVFSHFSNLGVWG